MSDAPGRLDRFRRRWLGIALTLIGVVSIVWLGATGRLELYVHPRYTVFTIVMALIGGATAIAAFVLVPAGEHEHDRPSRGRGMLAGVGTGILLLAAVGGLLVLPPATLSSATAGSRDIGSTTSLASADTTQLTGGDSTSFTVKDWASLLHQGLGDDFFTGKAADITGFLVPTDDPDVVYVARFLVTCCAVDAQPLGVPVLLPGWRDDHKADDWVEVTGAFAANPDAGAAEPIVLVPETVTPIDVPAQPYVY